MIANEEEKIVPTLKFPLGTVVMTRGVAEVTGTPYRLWCLARHARGDWGHVCKEDAATNDEALTLGNRILSSYPIDPAKPCKGWGENTFWIITEADRTMTTLLLPSEY